jgi:glutathione peroxidase
MKSKTAVSIGMTVAALALLGIALDASGRLEASEKSAESPYAALYQIPLRTIDGEKTTLAEHTGKALLIVNVASKCGLTPQYEALEALYRRYSDRGFTVLGFPCNQFGGQEPGSAEEIKRFCRLRYDVTFPMFEKLEVNGTERHPLYKVLTAVPDDSGYEGDIRWNFEKFVISADGTSIKRFAPATKPDSAAVVAAIEAGLPREN